MIASSQALETLKREMENNQRDLAAKEEHLKRKALELERAKRTCQSNALFDYRPP